MSQYTSRLDIIKKHSRILVTGPQRSGTTICSRILSSELGYEEINERMFRTHNVELFRELVKEKNNIVIQAPALSHKVAEISSMGFLVIYMIRNTKEIIQSQERINWTEINESIEKEKYKKYYGPPYFVDKDKPISEIKYQVFYNYLRKDCKNVIDMPYNCLKRSSLWVSKENRKDFTSHQTEI